MLKVDTTDSSKVHTSLHIYLHCTSVMTSVVSSYYKAQRKTIKVFIIHSLLYC